MMKKILTMLLSVAVAFGLWLYVITVVSPGSSDTIYNIPLIITGDTVLEAKGAKGGLMITSDIDDIQVDLHLSGNRSDLIQVNASNIVLKADVSGIDKPGRHSIDYTITWPGNVADNAFVVESRYPERIVITVEKINAVKLPVEIRYNGEVPEGFMTDKDNMELDYQEIVVTGPASEVEKLSYVTIEVDLTNRRDTIDQQLPYVLRDAEGTPVETLRCTPNAQQVHIRLPIQRCKELPLKLNFIPGGGATEQTIRYEMDITSLMVAGSEADLEGLEYIELGTVDLADYLEATTLTFPIALEQGLTNISGDTEVTVKLDFPNLKIRELTVENLMFEKLPAGMKAEFVNNKVKIRLRGPAAEIDALNPEDITLWVDLSSAQVGINTYPVRLALAKNFTNVGMLKDPQSKVYVNVTKG